MNYSKILRFCFLVFLLFEIIPVQAQQHMPLKLDTLEYKTIKFFEKKLNHQSRLNNGIIYEGYPGELLGNAYLNDTLSFTRGEITYDNVKFRDVPIMYDLVKDKVIIQVDGYSRLALVSEKISDFSLHGQNFINSSNISELGFSELAYKGKLEVLVKRTKTAEKVINSSIVKTEFRLKTEYFILKDGSLYKINNKSKIFKVLGDNKLSVSKILKENGLRFKRQPVNTLVTIAKLYDQIEK